MRQTTNYQLPSWDSDDRIMRTDFNELTEKVDTALKAGADSVTSLTSQLASKGNCQLYTTTYYGSGSSGSSSPTTISCSGMPQLVFIMDMVNGTTMVAIRNCRKAYAVNTAGTAATANWIGSTLQLTASNATGQMNQSGTSYLVVALTTV